MVDSVFDEAAQKRKSLQRIFNELPETTIVGAVGVDGPSGVKHAPETDWSLYLRMPAWREEGGPPNTSPLIISKMCSRDELTSLKANIRTESLLAFKGKLSLSNPFGDARAELISVIPDYTDPEVRAFLQHYSKPVKIIDPQFGQFSLNRRLDRFEGEAEWRGTKIRLLVGLDDEGSPESGFQTARALWADMTTWQERVDAYAVHELLDLKNDVWLGEGEDEDEVTAEKFVQLMCLESISVSSDGSFVFWHDDGDLFWGHAIQICGSLGNGLTRADIPG